MRKLMTLSFRVLVVLGILFAIVQMGNMAYFAYIQWFKYEFSVVWKIFFTLLVVVVDMSGAILLIGCRRDIIDVLKDTDIFWD